MPSRKHALPREAIDRLHVDLQQRRDLDHFAFKGTKGKAIHFAATARRFGRFAFELWLGRELVDRVRFDFPLLATETPAPASPRPIHDTPRFAPGARVSVMLRVPASERATRASILDRATGEVIDVTWPPRAASGTLLARDCPAPPARR